MHNGPKEASEVSDRKQGRSRGAAKQVYTHEFQDILVLFSSHKVMPKREPLMFGELVYSMCHPSWRFWEIQIIFWDMEVGFFSAYTTSNP